MRQVCTHKYTAAHSQHVYSIRRGVHRPHARILSSAKRAHTHTRTHSFGLSDAPAALISNHALRSAGIRAVRIAQQHEPVVAVQALVPLSYCRRHIVEVKTLALLLVEPLVSRSRTTYVYE